MKDLRNRGGYWRKPRVWGSLCALFGATFFAVAVIGMVVLPVRESKRAARLQTRIQSRYIAEDVMLRALTKKGFFDSGRALIAEGALAPDPTLPARVALRWDNDGNVLVARLRRGDKEFVYEGSYGYGELLREYSLSLGQGDPSGEWNPNDIRILGSQARLKLVPQRKEIQEDPKLPESGAKKQGSPLKGSLLVRHLKAIRPFDALVSGGVTRAGTQNDAVSSCFQRKETLPQEYLGKPTDLDDFTLVSRGPDSGVVVFESERGAGLRVRVEGNLWLGEPGKTLRISTQGKALVIQVTGNLYVLGELSMVGERDTLFLLVGEPGCEAFRDTDANGHREPREVRIPGRSPRLFPCEGRGLAYLGLPGTNQVMLEAFLVAEHDVLIGEKGALVRGTVLAGGRLIRRGGEQPGPLELNAGARFRDMSLPILGLPKEPGSELKPRVLRVGLAEVRDFRY